MKAFLDADFLLRTETAVRLFHNYAAAMPIYDYHCHLPAQQIAENEPFKNITQIWLYGDHYKWRGMRSNGVAEKFCTGDASDKEKFDAWAATVPHTLRNPLHLWTHLELKRYFGIEKVLGPDTADEIWEQCNRIIQEEKLTPHAIFTKMNVKALCTTDDPVDSLEYHRQIAETGCPAKVYPTFRPDKAVALEDPAAWNAYVDTLAGVCGTEIKKYDDLTAALKSRHEYFHAAGCRLSDHGMEVPVAEHFTDAEIVQAFDHIRGGAPLDRRQRDQLKTALMVRFGTWNAEKGWVMQLHMGAIRNNSSRLFGQLGPDTGFDSIGDGEVAKPLSRFLDMLDSDGKLPKTILYNLNPKDNEVLATMLGNFQDGSVPGKMQFGSGWWFLDQKDGMEKQMNALSALGLLSRFVGMLTDSRSLLSYPRHEYFRRILCNLLGNDMENGEIPADMELVGKMVQDICYNNAVEYFGLEL